MSAQPTYAHGLVKLVVMGIYLYGAADFTALLFEVTGLDRPLPAKLPVRLPPKPDRATG